MIILEDRDQLMALIDSKTSNKVKTSRDYAITTTDGNILTSFRWMDRSIIVLYTTPEDTMITSTNDKAIELADGVTGTGREQLFEYMLKLASDDLNKLDKLDDRVISFEEKLFDGKGLTQENFQTLHRFRKEGWNKKRYFERMELLTDQLMAIDPDFDFIDNKYDKLLNHILRTQEYLDQIRQSYEAQIGIEQNNLMKFFTVVTSIFLPLSLIAGWYGMNLMMPEFKWIYSYPFVIVLSIAIIAIMLWLFRKNKWL